MIKTILKETIIFILLLAVIVLLLGVLFYNYMPNTKVLPLPVEPYKLSEEISKELEEAATDGENVIKTYYIDGTDLSNYQATNSYDKGKINPFERYDTNANGADGEGSTSSGSSSNGTNTNTSK